MTRVFWLTTCLGLAACGKASLDGVTTDDRRGEKQHKVLRIEPRAYSVRITCRVNSVYIGVSACLVGSVGAPDGELTIRSGASVRRYTGPEIMKLERQAPGPIVAVDLQMPFQIMAQTAGEDRYVLRVDVLAGGAVISSDETAGYGVVALESASPE